MQSKKLTPLEILQKQKTVLQAKSDELGESIENHAKYLQGHFVPLLRDSMMETVFSKMPPYLQVLADSFLRKKQKAITRNSATRRLAFGIAAGIAEIVPVFFKGKKGAILSILLKQIIKWVKF